MCGRILGAEGFLHNVVYIDCSVAFLGAEGDVCTGGYLSARGCVITHGVVAQCGRGGGPDGPPVFSRQPRPALSVFAHRSPLLMLLPKCQTFDHELLGACSSVDSRSNPSLGNLRSLP